MSPPQRVALVLGTGTAVGKTWVTARLSEQLKESGRLVQVRKPVQSFDPEDGLTDAEVLARASGERPDEVCPPHRAYPLPMAPPMAAEVLEREPFTISDLVSETTWSDAHVGLVEAVGGVRSPMASDGDCVDFAAALQPDSVLLVADAGLGTLNLVRLCAQALAGHSVLVYLNHFDAAEDLHQRNARWLERDGLGVEASIGALGRRLATCVCPEGAS